MFDLIVSPNKPWHQAVRLLVTLLIVLLLGKLVSMLSVMQKLVLFHTIKAGDAVWFVTEISALYMFYFFARFTIESLPKKGAFVHFLRGIANPLAILVMVILIQDLIWQLLAPFVSHTGKSIYFGSAILLIVAVSVWLVIKAYEYASHLAISLDQLGDAVSKQLQARKSICSNCKAEVSSKAHFCDKCGHKMPESRYCPECGVAVADDQKYCRDCGADLNFTQPADSSE
ncbi:zinc ribbon domain-containing protein [Methylomonas sp. MgM2]